MKPTGPEPKDKTPSEAHTGVTQGWQSGVGDSYPDTHAEPSPEKQSKDDAGSGEIQ
jgi:hypothetical protein